MHRDGLVHVSELTHRWVADPREAVQVGEIVKVKVMEVDYQRERIGLSIKVLQTPPAQQARQTAGSASRGARPDQRQQGKGGRPEAPASPSRPAPAPAKPSGKMPPPAKQQPSSIEDLMRKFNRR